MSAFRYILLFMLFPVLVYGQQDVQEVLFESIKKNNLPQVRKIVEKHPYLIDSPLVEDQFLVNVKKYPIHQAFRYANIELIDYLLSNGANAARKQKSSAIMRFKTRSCFELLVEYRNLRMLKYYHNKIPIEIVDFTDALKQAAEAEANEKVKFLLEKGEVFLIR